MRAFKTEKTPDALVDIGVLIYLFYFDGTDFLALPTFIAQLSPDAQSKQADPVEEGEDCS